MYPTTYELLPSWVWTPEFVTVFLLLNNCVGIEEWTWFYSKERLPKGRPVRRGFVFI